MAEPSRITNGERHVPALPAYLHTARTAGARMLYVEAWDVWARHQTIEKAHQRDVARRDFYAEVGRLVLDRPDDR